MSFLKLLTFTQNLLQVSVVDKNITSDKLSDSMELSDYVLVGDIVQVCTLLLADCSYE